MNWFMLAMGFLCIGATVQELCRRNWTMAIVYAAWAAADFALAIGGK